MDKQEALPFLTEPHDALRLGVRSLKEDASVSHPVEAIQANAPKQQEALRLKMMRDLYGPGLPACRQIETQILSKVGRLPGMPSSKLGLQSLTGELDTFGFESYLGAAPEEREVPGPDLHSQMEARLRLGTKPCARSL